MKFKIKRLFQSEKQIPFTKNKFYDFVLEWVPIFGFKPMFNFKFDLFDETTWLDFNFSLFAGIIEISIEWTRRRDHAGFIFNLTLFGLDIFLQIYDNRHWDYSSETWFKEGENLNY